MKVRDLDFRKPIAFCRTMVFPTGRAMRSWWRGILRKSFIEKLPFFNFLQKHRSLHHSISGVRRSRRACTLCDRPTLTSSPHWETRWRWAVENQIKITVLISRALSPRWPERNCTRNKEILAILRLCWEPSEWGLSKLEESSFTLASKTIQSAVEKLLLCFCFFSD